MVEKEFPTVQLIKLKKNIGIAGWNEGFKVARGEYVLVLDDDAYPNKNTILKSLNEFSLDPNIACITFNMFDIVSNKFIDSNWSPSEIVKKNKIYWPIFCGCAVIFSAKKINLNYIMPDDYFLYQHELPVSAEIYLHGYKILFDKDIIAYHRFKRNEQYKVFNDALCLKNNLLFINKYLPVYFSILYNIQLFIFYLSRSIRKGWLKDYIKIITCVNYFNWNKRKISLSYFKDLRKLHIFNFNILSKFKNI